METSTKKAIRNVASLLEQVRVDHGDIPVQMFTTLLAIAMNEGASQQQIMKVTKQSKAAVSRNINAWTNWTRHRERGPGYVRLDEDPYDRRHHMVKLTPQGQKYLDDLFSRV